MANAKDTPTGKETAQEQQFLHDAFVSYSRKDKSFAVQLEKALEGYRPPKGLPVPQRPLRVFRDEDDFTGAEYYQSLSKQLNESRKLLVICSPYARGSVYVNDEIRRFAEHRGADNIIPLLLSGIPNNEVTPGKEAEMAFPDALSQLLTMPLAVSYLGFDAKRNKVNKGLYENAWYSTLANVYETNRSDIEQREKKRETRRRRVRNGIVGGIIAVLFAAFIVTFYYYRDAEAARLQAQDRLAQNYWSSAAKAETQGDWLTATHYFARAAREAQDSAQVRNAMLGIQGYPQQTFLVSQRLYDNRVFGSHFDGDESLILTENSDHSVQLRKAADGTALGPPLKNDGRVVGAIWSHDASLILTWSKNEVAQLWKVVDGARVGPPLKHSADINGASFNHDGTLILTWAWDTAQLWKAADGTPVGLPLRHKRDIEGASFSPDESLILTWSDDRSARIWRATDGHPVGPPLKHDLDVKSAIWNHDGSRILTLGLNGDSARLWKAPDGTPVGPPLKHQG
jgi:hypothetical protein